MGGWSLRLGRHHLADPRPAPGYRKHFRAFVNLLFFCSLLATVYVLFNSPAVNTLFGRALLGWTVLEACFFAFLKWRLIYLGERPKPVHVTTRLEEVLARFEELQQVFHINEFLSGWFFGAEPSVIKRGNLEDFGAMAIFNQELSALSKSEKVHVEKFLDGVERAWGVNFPEGRNTGIRCMQWLWEPLRVYHKPLVMYIGTETLGRMTYALLWAMGFKMFEQSVFKYWVRLPPTAASEAHRARSFHGSVATAAGELWRLGSDPEEEAAVARAILAKQATAYSGPRWRAWTPRWLGDLLSGAVFASDGTVHTLVTRAVDAVVDFASAAAAAATAQHPHGAPHGPPLAPTVAAPPAGFLGEGAALSPSRSSPIPETMAAIAAAAAAEGTSRSGGVEFTFEPVAERGAAPPQMSRLQSAPVVGMPSGGEGQGAPGPRGTLGARRSLRFRTFKIPPRTPSMARAAVALDAEVVDRREAGGAVSAAEARELLGKGPFEGAPQGRAQEGASPTTGAQPKAPVPIVFMHGVGCGTLPYLGFVRDVMDACPESPVMMLEVKHVALRLCKEAAAVDEVAHAVAAVLRKHGFERACMTGHSYGTFVISRICQLYPEMVHSVAVMDPVCMMTCYPQLLYNFVYRAPTLQDLSSLLGVLDLARYFCSRDLLIAQAFCRKFSWVDLMLWPQDLPPASLVVLSGQDDLVPSELVMAQLQAQGHPAKVMYHPDLGHGGMLISPKWQAEVVASVKELVEGGWAEGKAEGDSVEKQGVEDGELAGRANGSAHLQEEGDGGSSLEIRSAGW